MLAVCVPHSSYRVSTLPLAMSTRWIEPWPEYDSGGGEPGRASPITSCQSKQPPLLQTYTAPSGPTAAPLGPPPLSATTSLSPVVDVDARQRAACDLDEHDAAVVHRDGPSGKRSPLAISRSSATAAS